MNSCMTWRALSMSPTAAFTTLRHALDRHARLRERIVEALAGLQDVAQAFASVGPTALPCSTIDSVSCFVSSSTRCTLRDHAS